MSSAIPRRFAPWTSRRRHAGAVWAAMTLLLAALPARGAEVAAPRLTALAGGGAGAGRAGARVSGWDAPERLPLTGAAGSGTSPPPPPGSGGGAGADRGTGAGAAAIQAGARPQPGGRGGRLRAEPLPLIEE